MHQKRRLELIIERMALERAGRILEAAGLTGYTVISAMSGYGGGVRWSRGSDISATQDMVVVISIGSTERVDAALTQLHDLLDDHIGVLNVATVDVMRPELF
ncbi:transcriptional regulator [bacterium]|nr:transcriptional regulator [bacterium]